MAKSLCASASGASAEFLSQSVLDRSKNKIERIKSMLLKYRSYSFELCSDPAHF